MRVVHDGFANIDSKDGTRLHAKVRVQRDDQNRVAVFTNPNTGPEHVYSLADVNVSPTGGGGCSHPVCRGKANRQKLTRLWEKSEKVTA